MKRFMILGIAALSCLLVGAGPALAGKIVIRNASHPAIIRSLHGPGPGAYTRHPNRPPYRSYRNHPVIRDECYPRRQYPHGRPYPSRAGYPAPVREWGPGVSISVGTWWGW